MFIPQSMGGLGLSLPEVVGLEESLAWADGSTGWVATLCAGAGWFVGFVEPELAREFFTGDRVCVAGSGNATGTAELLREGYLINGSWPYASGALHATAFTANCVIHHNGIQQMDEVGAPLILPFVFKPSEVQVHKTWKATGMVATGSHSFSVANMRVATNRCFRIDPQFAQIDDPVYRFPFLQLAEATLVANISGMTIRFLELAIELSERDLSLQSDSDFKLTTQMHGHAINELRQQFFQRVDDAWYQLNASQIVTRDTLHNVSEICHALAHACQTATAEIYQLCPLGARIHESACSRVWRNIQTALSHALFRKHMGLTQPSM